MVNGNIFIRNAIFVIFLFGFGSFYFLHKVELKYPSYFPAPTYDFSSNQLTEDGIELGRALFYDPILSKDLSVSCATCHSPYSAFAHSDHALSHGIHDSVGFRNAPALFNLAWQPSFMWDGAIQHLDFQPLTPISDPKEMGSSINLVVERIQNSSIYPKLFYHAFADSIINGEKVLKALSQFQLSLISAESKYDAVQKGIESFNEQQSNGYRLFLNNCSSCHAEPLFSTYEFKSNGLIPDTSLADSGRKQVTQEESDAYLFKVPSLRNLSYSYPYMHDGRFNTLSEVVAHYTQQENLNIQLTSNEQVDLIAFLLTLNDEKFVFNPKNQYPRQLFLKDQ